MHPELINNQQDKRYELHYEDGVAFVEYIIAKDSIYLTHTEVPKILEGKGIGSHIIKEVLIQVEKDDYKLIPLCPFVAHYLKNNPEWKKLVYKGINVG